MAQVYCNKNATQIGIIAYYVMKPKTLIQLCTVNMKEIIFINGCWYREAVKYFGSVISNIAKIIYV